MNINNLWYICLLVRLAFIVLIRNTYKTKASGNIVLDNMPYILIAMGAGFIYKGFTGSNDETQIAKVFWHNTRYIHGIIYVLSGIYLYNGDVDMNTVLLSTDIAVSILYRVITNQ